MRQLKMADLHALRDGCTNPRQRTQWDTIIADMAPNEGAKPRQARSSRSARTQSAADLSPIVPVSRQATLSTTFASIVFLVVVVMALIWIPRIVYWLLDGVLSALTMS